MTQTPLAGDKHRACGSLGCAAFLFLKVARIEREREKELCFVMRSWLDEERLTKVGRLLLQQAPEVAAAAAAAADDEDDSKIHLSSL